MSSSRPATGRVTSAEPTEGINAAISVTRPKKIGLGAREMKKPPVATAACAAAVMKLAPSTERATVRSSSSTARTRP